MTDWGKLLSTTGSLAETFGTEQPFRYRGYVYDEETGWYYLQSRYYNPEVDRFISADVYLSTGQGVLGHNAYAYCLNNPVNMFDPYGEFALCAIGLIGMFLVLLEGATSCSSRRVDNSTFYNPDGRDDISFDWDGSNLSITTYVQFDGSGATEDFVMNAIESYWSGVFTVEGKQVTVNTNVINGISPKGGYLPITLSPESGRSGSMYIYCDGDSNLMWTIAHEFGHQIGLYDAYRRGTNGDSPAPYDSVMNWFNMSVTNLDIARVIAYVEGGGMQVYP